MTVAMLPRRGEMTVTTEPSAGTAGPGVIEFVTPIPGFPDHRRFLLTRIDESELLYALRSVDDPELRFLVMAPGPFFPEYEPEIADATLDVLGVHEAERLLVLLVVSAGGTAREATANLLAPILVDRVTRRAVQVVLTGESFPLRAPLAVA